MRYTTYHDLLVEELETRKQINSSYSLRAFARDLGLAAPRLSQVLNRKQGFSVDAAETIANRLRLDEETRKWFCSSVGANHARSATERKQFESKMKGFKVAAKQASEMQVEFFKVISDWYHFAILEMTYLSDFKNDPNWMASVLGVTELEVTEAIQRMLDLELLENKDGKLIDCFRYLETQNEIPSLSLKKFHSQLMKKGMEAMYRQEPANREYASNIFAIEKSRLPEFKETIKDFKRKFDYSASQGEEKDAVYCLSLQFYELTDRQEEQK